MHVGQFLGAGCSMCIIALVQGEWRRTWMRSALSLSGNGFQSTQSSIVHTGRLPTAIADKYVCSPSDDHFQFPLLV